MAGSPIDSASVATSSTEAPRIRASFAGSTAFQLRQTNSWTRSGKYGLRMEAGASPCGRTVSPAQPTPAQLTIRKHVQVRRRIILPLLLRPEKESIAPLLRAGLPTPSVIAHARKHAQVRARRGARVDARQAAAELAQGA